MKASASWCTVCLGLLENKIPKPWKVSLSVGSAFIWQQQQNVSLFHAWVPFFFTVAVQNLLNQEIQLYTLKITCQCLQHLPPIHCSVCSCWFCLHWAFIYFLLVFCFLFFFQIWSSALFPLPATVDICSCSPTVQNCRRNVCPRSWHTWI